MNKWEEEIELIDNLGLLYPKIGYWPEYNKDWNNETKALWVYYLCVYHLNQRVPQLEEFIKCYLSDYLDYLDYYKKYFKIK